MPKKKIPQDKSVTFVKPGKKKKLTGFVCLYVKFSLGVCYLNGKVEFNCSSALWLETLMYVLTKLITNFNIPFSIIADRESPVLQCPQSRQVIADEGYTFTVVEWEPPVVRNTQKNRS